MTARLIVMDIDSTLINQEVIDLLGEEAGVGEQVAQITERAMCGELDFKQAHIRGFQHGIGRVHGSHHAIHFQ